MRMYWESVPGRGNRRCKGPEVEPVWHSRSSKEPSWVGAEWSRDRGWTSTVTPGALSLRDCAVGDSQAGRLLPHADSVDLVCWWMFVVNYDAPNCAGKCPRCPPSLSPAHRPPWLCCLVLTAPSWEHSSPLALQMMSTPAYLSYHFF